MPTKDHCNYTNMNGIQKWQMTFSIVNIPRTQQPCQTQPKMSPQDPPPTAISMLWQVFCHLWSSNQWTTTLYSSTDPANLPWQESHKFGSSQDWCDLWFCLHEWPRLFLWFFGHWVNGWDLLFPWIWCLFLHIWGVSKIIRVCNYVSLTLTL